MASNRLLIIEDDSDYRGLLALAAGRIGYDVLEVDPPLGFLGLYRSFNPDLIVLDLMMPGVDGVQVLRKLADEKCTAQIILLSAVAEQVLDATARIAEASGLRVRETLRKPIAIEAIHEALSKYFIWSPDLSAEKLADAIDAKQIDVVYQPIADLSGEAKLIRAIEACPSWRHADGGAIRSDHIFELAQEPELAERLTATVLETGCEQVRKLFDAGYALDLAVTLPLALSQDTGLPDRLAAIAKRHCLPAIPVVIQIDEAASLLDPSVTSEALARFPLQGFRLALDRFGRGQSALPELYRMPLEELKIDASLIGEAAWNEKARRLIRGLIAVAHDLGLKVTASGVENGEVLEFLRRAACDRAQGHLIAKTLSAGELRDFLKENLYHQSASITRRRTL